MNKYRCKWCNKIVERDSSKRWIKSYCDDTGKDVHLILVKTKGLGSPWIAKSLTDEQIEYEKAGRIVDEAAHDVAVYVQKEQYYADDYAPLLKTDERCECICHKHGMQHCSECFGGCKVDSLEKGYERHHHRVP